MSFGKLQASLASATSEITVAAANINFDFTLVKYEAPKEFQPLRDVLSLKRKEEAESGATHVLARRLGALPAQKIMKHRLFAKSQTMDTPQHLR
jgi:hypothetical protein